MVDSDDGTVPTTRRRLLKSVPATAGSLSLTKVALPSRAHSQPGSDDLDVNLDVVDADSCLELEEHVDSTGVRGSLHDRNYPGRLSITEYFLEPPSYTPRSRDPRTFGAPYYYTDEGQACYYSDGFDVSFPLELAATRLEWSRSNQLSEPCQREWDRVSTAAERRARQVATEVRAVVAEHERQTRERWANNYVEVCGDSLQEAGTAFNERLEREITEEWQTLIADLQGRTFAEDLPPPTLDCTPCEREITVSGLLGDVIRVSLPEEYSDFAFEPEQTTSHPDVPAGHENQATEVGYVAQVEDWKNKLSKGQFWFVPVETGSGSLQVRARDGEEPVRFSVRIDVTDGYSTSGDDAVTFETGRIDAYRQQKRLLYLGFPGDSKNPPKRCCPPQFDQQDITLAANGDGDDENTSWARGLFVSVVRGGQRYVGRVTLEAFSDPEQYGLEKQFLNAENAPRWVELFEGGFQIPLTRNRCATPREDVAQFERWATDWAEDLLGSVAVRAPSERVLPMTGASIETGGPTPCHGGHETGLQIDVDTPSSDTLDPPFYRTREIQGTEYVAARTPTDPVGDEHVVVEDAPGEFSAAFAAEDLEPPTNAIPHRLLTDLTYLIRTGDRRRRQERTARLREILAGIAHLIVDNPETDPPYDHEAIRAELDAFLATRTESGATVDSILYDDPRLWRIDSVRFVPGHSGHYHVNVRPPAQPR